MVVVLFISEMIISFEAAGVVANWLGSLFGIPPGSAILYLISSLAIPTVIIGILLMVKQITNPAEIESRMKELNELYETEAIDEGTYLSQFKALKRKASLLTAGKLAYLATIVAFYGLSFLAIRNAEASTLTASFEIPELETAVHDASGIDFSTLFSGAEEATGLSYSTLVGGLMLIVLVGHAFAVFSRQPLWGVDLPMGNFDPVKNKRAMEKVDAKILDQSRELIKIIKDPKNQEFAEVIIEDVPPPVQRAINDAWEFEVFEMPKNTRKGRDFEELRGDLGLETTYQPNGDDEDDDGSGLTVIPMGRN